MTSPDDLIARVEAATGPDRELDCLIFFYVKGIDEDASEWVAEREFDGEERGPIMSSLADHLFGVPKFSESIDSAVGLVPEGFSIHMTIQVDGLCFCYVHSNALVLQASAPGALSLPDRKPPAIALCAAALRARKMENER